jgi:hypothetical protein
MDRGDARIVEFRARYCEPVHNAEYSLFSYARKNTLRAHTDAQCGVKDRRNLRQNPSVQSARSSGMCHGQVGQNGVKTLPLQFARAEQLKQVNLRINSVKVPLLSGLIKRRYWLGELSGNDLLPTF